MAKKQPVNKKLKKIQSKVKSRRRKIMKKGNY